MELTEDKKTHLIGKSEEGRPICIDYSGEAHG